MRQRSAQSAFRKATQRAGITKLDVAIPTLRHAYATHLLEARINLLALPWGASVSRCLASIWRAAGAIGLDLLGAVHWQQL